MQVIQLSSEKAQEDFLKVSEYPPAGSGFFWTGALSRKSGFKNYVFRNQASIFRSLKGSAKNRSYMLHGFPRKFLIFSKKKSLNHVSGNQTKLCLSEFRIEMDIENIFVMLFGRILQGGFYNREPCFSANFLKFKELCGRKSPKFIRRSRSARAFSASRLVGYSETVPRISEHRIFSIPFGPSSHQRATHTLLRFPRLNREPY